MKTVNIILILTFLLLAGFMLSQFVVPCHKKVANNANTTNNNNNEMVETFDELHQEIQRVFNDRTELLKQHTIDTVDLRKRTNLFLSQIKDMKGKIRQLMENNNNDTAMSNTNGVLMIPSQN